MERHIKHQRAQELRAAGMTFEQIAETCEVNERTVRRWLSQGDYKRAAKQDNLSERTWTAADLLALGFVPETVERLVLLLDATARMGNDRLSRFLDGIATAPRVPSDWRAALAWFPILAKDIDAPAVADLANVIRETAPWASDSLRRRYRAQAAPIITHVLGSVTMWALPVGLVVMAPVGRPERFETFEELANDTGLHRRAADASLARLIKGDRPQVISLLPGQAFERGIAKDFKQTPYGIVAEVVQRLPDIDKRKRFSRAPTLLQLAIAWCALSATQLRGE